METIINNNLNNAKNTLTEWFNNSNSTEKEKDYAIKHSRWVEEKQIKNKMIRTKDNQETVQRKRTYVFWASLGMNVGSELCEDHFSVVIAENAKTATIVPLSSKKEGIVKSQNDGYFDIGVIEDLPIPEKSAYAVISQIRSVSKKRLSNYRVGPRQYIEIMLTDDQMNIIDNAIKSQLTNF